MPKRVKKIGNGDEKDASDYIEKVILFRKESARPNDTTLALHKHQNGGFRLFWRQERTGHPTGQDALRKYLILACHGRIYR